MSFAYRKNEYNNKYLSKERTIVYCGSLSTVVGDEKLTSREGQIGPLFMYV